VYTLSIPWTASLPDSHNLRVVIDPFGQTQEASYSNNSGDGLVVIGQGATEVGEVDAALPLGIAEVWPVPARSEVHFRLHAPAGEVASISIFDVRGRRVRTVDLGQEGGVLQWRWDGRDDSGRIARNGVYFARLRSLSVESTRRVVILR